MAHVLEETPTKGDPVVVPSHLDGGIAAALRPGFQALANRVRFCEDALDTTGGNHPIKNVAALADLTAVGSPATGDVRAVDGFGLYRFTSGDTTTPFSPWVVTHASGRWIHVTYSSIADNDVGATLATLVDGKLPVARHANAILRSTRTDFHGVIGAACASTSVASWQGTAIAHIELGLLVGDEVLIEAETLLSSSSPTAWAYALLRVTENYLAPGATTDDAATEVRAYGDSPLRFVLRRRHVVAAAGPMRIAIAIMGDGTNNSRLHFPSHVGAMVIRP